jgi:hypothetical protein
MYKAFQVGCAAWAGSVSDAQRSALPRVAANLMFRRCGKIKNAQAPLRTICVVTSATARRSPRLFGNHFHLHVGIRVDADFSGDFQAGFDDRPGVEIRMNEQGAGGR